MLVYRIFGGLVCGLFLLLSSSGWSCSDDRNSGGSRGMGGVGRGSSGFRTYHK